MKKPTSKKMTPFEMSKMDKEQYKENSPKDKAMDKKQMPSFLKKKK